MGAAILWDETECLDVTQQRFLVDGLGDIGVTLRLERSQDVLGVAVARQHDHLYAIARRALNDLLERNDFITSRMTQDTTGRELRGRYP